MMIDISDVAADLPVRPGLDLVLQHESTIDGVSHHHSQIFTAGRLEDWRSGVAPDAAATMRRPVEHSWLDVFSGGVSAMIETAQWVWEFDGGSMCSSWPPTGEVAARIGRSLPDIPGASLTVGLTTTDLIDDGLRYEQEFIDGHLVAANFRHSGTADLELQVPLLDYCRFLIGDMPFLELMYCGSVRGGIPELSVIAGLVEQDRFQELITPFRGVAAISNRLIQLLNHPAVATFIGILAERSSGLALSATTDEVTHIHCTMPSDDGGLEPDQEGGRHAAS